MKGVAMGLRPCFLVNVGGSAAGGGGTPNVNRVILRRRNPQRLPCNFATMCAIRNSVDDAEEDKCKLLKNY